MRRSPEKCGASTAIISASETPTGYAPQISLTGSHIGAYNSQVSYLQTKLGSIAFLGSAFAQMARRANTICVVPRMLAGLGQLSTHASCFITLDCRADLIVGKSWYYTVHIRNHLTVSANTQGARGVTPLARV